MIDISVSLSGPQIMRELLNDSEELFYAFREELIEKAPHSVAKNIADGIDAGNIEEMATWFDSFASELRRQADG